MNVYQRFEKIGIIAQRCLALDDFVRFICGSFWIVAMRIFLIFLVFRHVNQQATTILSHEYFLFLFIGLIFISVIATVYALTMKFFSDEKKRKRLELYESTPTRLIGMLCYIFVIYAGLECVIVSPVYYIFGRDVLHLQIPGPEHWLLPQFFIICIASLALLFGCVLIGSACIVYFDFVPFDGWTSVYVLNIFCGVICAVDRLPKWMRHISVFIPFTHGLSMLRGILLQAVVPSFTMLGAYCLIALGGVLGGLGVYQYAIRKARERGVL